MFYLSHLENNIFLTFLFYNVFLNLVYHPPQLIKFFQFTELSRKKFIENSSLKTPQKMFLAKPKNKFNFKILFIKDFLN